MTNSRKPTHNCHARAGLLALTAAIFLSASASAAQAKTPLPFKPGPYTGYTNQKCPADPLPADVCQAGQRLPIRFVVGTHAIRRLSVPIVEKCIQPRGVVVHVMSLPGRHQGSVTTLNDTNEVAFKGKYGVFFMTQSFGEGSGSFGNDTFTSAIRKSTGSGHLTSAITINSSGQLDGQSEDLCFNHSVRWHARHTNGKQPTLRPQHDRVAALDLLPWHFAARPNDDIAITGLAAEAGISIASNLTPEQQQCVDIAINGLRIYRKPVMREAGIRPFTPGMPRRAESVDAAYGEPLPPDGSVPGQPDCVPKFHFLSGQQLQMQKPHHRGTWLNLYKVGPNFLQGIPGQSITRGEFSWGPPHAWPSWVFNQCTDGKGWLMVRNKVTLVAKDIQTDQVDGERTYTLPVLVKGSCKAAARSARLTKNAKQQWGNNSS